jgi:hypothetical protein
MKEQLTVVSNNSTNQKFDIKETSISREQSQEIVSKVNSSNTHKAEVKEGKVIVREFLRD